MKHLICSIFMLTTLMISSSVLADRPLSSSTGFIDRIDHSRFLMVIDDRKVAVDKNVKVHSEFVKHDYFSRLKKGMKIKFKLIKQDGIPMITEVWVQ